MTNSGAPETPEEFAEVALTIRGLDGMTKHFKVALALEREKAARIAETSEVLHDCYAPRNIAKDIRDTR